MIKNEYKRPFCGTIETAAEVALMAGSGNGIGKNDPIHGGEDNLAKQGEFFDDEETDEDEWEN
ncbi:hypothetical protein [Hoylesella shahii]|jgi:hypothetical protein|uniref:Uncharacterized protein n=1 Tax=Hoylesella shahii DSM 15611 = JCM 12083 TaxID=1122991 RepID=A0A318HZZ5_9BACT|nr:hypothetical protein [Hoylesella shahii]PXX23923.1 hypothetical protein EJ73_00519 [Hoylesella shahii DSM 15611 = JCM 12083]